MPSFAYLAKSRDGQRREGAIDAPDRRTALARLQRAGLVPIRVADAASAPPATPAGDASRRVADKPAAAAGKTPAKASA
ncbi:MAG: hypothetical protein IJT88_09335, partial [Kiritimatiellae bacterium]|nr:hypothetical protein [Kiritimatiellia bacterium]